MTAKPHPHNETEPCPGGCVELEAVDSRFADGDLRMGRIEATQAAMSAEISEVLEILRMGKSFFKVAGYFGDFVKWLIPIGASMVSLYYMFKNGGKQ